MDKNADLYNLTQTVQGTLYQAGQNQYLASLSDDERDNQPQRPPLLNLRAGYAESIGWMLVQFVEFAPEPLTVEKFRIRAVYSAPRLTQALLEIIASEKWADRQGDDYCLTDEGRSVIDTILNQRNIMFAQFEPIPIADLIKLVDYSERIMQASLNSGNEQTTWCLRHSQNRKPHHTASPVAKLIHVASDFNAFRDDTHMRAYTEQGVDGMTWEAFSFVVDGRAKTASDLFDQLAYRGWTVYEWQSALDYLVDKGWLIGDSSSYQPTEQGKTIHQTVEQQTDTLFYAPWATLSPDEQIDYIQHLNKLNDTCTALISQ